MVRTLQRRVVMALHFQYAAMSLPDMICARNGSTLGSCVDENNPEPIAD
jgi:hypothetical protein